MQYVSTRAKNNVVESAQAIVKGLSETITELYSVHYYRLQLTLMIFRKER